tara:strand:+ start:2046 stop:2315 length:270 start_codon:yes stop_codon:yes gene_type:complete
MEYIEVTCGSNRWYKVIPAEYCAQVLMQAVVFQSDYGLFAVGINYFLPSVQHINFMFVKRVLYYGHSNCYKFVVCHTLSPSHSYLAYHA